MKKLNLALLMMVMMIAPCLCGAQRNGAPREILPTWLHRHIPNIPVKVMDISTASCRYQPIFGDGDSEARVARSVARVGQVTIDPHGDCKEVTYPHEEQIYYILSGNGTLSYGAEKSPVKQDDFMYLPPGIPHGLADNSGAPLRFVVMGFRIPPGTPIVVPPKLQIANSNDVKWQFDEGHPKSTQYRLLLGNREGHNDKLDCGTVVTSLFLMRFVPGGTNFPHHHDLAEELYIILHGHGNEAAGGGENGVVGLHPAGPGDAYFYRMNATVGFYNTGKTNAYILAVRSWYPLPKRDYQN